MGDGGDIRISGGAGGISAHYEDMLTYAGVLDTAGDGLREASGRLGGLVVSGDLAEATILCPVEVAEAEGAIIAAATGPSGALWVGGELEISARYLRTSVSAYKLVDEKLAQLEDLAFDAAGYALGAALPGLALLGGAGYLWLQGNPLLLELLDALGVEGPTLDDLQETLYDNPWMLEALTRMAPGLIQGTSFTLAGLLGPTGTLALYAASGGNWPSTDYQTAIAGLLSIAGLGGLLQDTGEFEVAPVPGTTELDINSSNFVQTIFDQQGKLGDEANPGQVQVIKVDGVPPSYIVQIPGTQDWNPTRSDNPVDLTTNVNLMAMQGTTVMEAQVAAAMKAAGIQPGDPVMLTGHSQGGITAAAMASDPALEGTFNITSVVTGGSPIGRFDIPSDVSVLSLEHDQDPVPKLDGADNPDRSNWTTVSRELTDEQGTSAEGVRGPMGAHDTVDYQQTGSQIDRSTDASLEEWREQNQEFFGTEPATVNRYQISPAG